ncbi:MAG: hypothetical protein ACRC5R_03735 [Mycoplasmatales bacterium]
MVIVNAPMKRKEIKELIAIAFSRDNLYLKLEWKLVLNQAMVMMKTILLE